MAVMPGEAKQFMFASAGDFHFLNIKTTENFAKQYKITLTCLYV